MVIVPSRGLGRSVEEDPRPAGISSVPRSEAPFSPNLALPRIPFLDADQGSGIPRPPNTEGKEVLGSARPEMTNWP